VKLISYFF